MVENEQNILGAILMDSDVISKVYDKIKPEMFEYSFHQDTYREMIKLYDLGKPIDISLIAQHIQDKDKSEEFVNEQLRNIALATSDDVFSSMKIDTYADVLITDWRTREVRGMLETVDVSSNNINNTIGDLMTRLESLQINRKSPLKSLKQIVEKCKGDYFNDDKGEGDVKTGIYALDEMIVSFPKKTLSIIAARPSVGKTAFAIQIAKNQAKKGKKVAIFSLEMDDSEQYERLVSAESGIDLTRLQKAKAYLGDEEERFNKGNEKLSELNIYLACGSYTVAEINNLVKHQDFDMIIIDYLQLIEPDKRYKGNRTAEVGEISRALKKMAMQLDTRIIALSQLNRASEGKKNKEPDMSELRESGSLEQDASIILMLWNLNDDDNCIYKGMKVAKCRQGKKGKIGMKFDGDHMTFEPRQEDFWKWEKQAKEQAKDFKPTDDLEDMFK